MIHIKRKLLSFAILLIIIFASYWIGTGLLERSDVVLVDYSVSEDGTEITLNAGVSGSMGYIRGYKDKGGGVKPHYITFYATFGGLNSAFGSKNEFVLQLSPNDTEIYFNRADGGYEVVLVKDEETGRWFRPNKIGI